MESNGIHEMMMTMTLLNMALSLCLVTTLGQKKRPRRALMLDVIDAPVELQDDFIFRSPGFSKTLL